MIPCFFLEATDLALIALRRYSKWDSGRRCAGNPKRICDAMFELGSVPVIQRDSENHYDLVEAHPNPPHDDPRWPTVCDTCGTPFEPDDAWQPWYERMYKRSDNGELTTLRRAPAGALWFADWLLGYYAPSPDGHVLICRTPGGDWNIDSRASNCTQPDDKVHHCWIRHGDPLNPIASGLTVDKNGLTCQAGAGSIQSGDYHGFLQNGHLT